MGALFAQAWDLFTLIYFDLRNFRWFYNFTLIYINLRWFASVFAPVYVNLRLFMSRDSQDDGPNMQHRRTNIEIPIHNGGGRLRRSAHFCGYHYGWVFLYLSSCFCIFGPSSWLSLDIDRRKFTYTGVNINTNQRTFVKTTVHPRNLVSCLTK
jgi:hypothetical protein